MTDRTQLNVNINPELLKTLKQNAIKSGMTLTNYVTQLIKVYVSKEDLLEEDNEVTNRIDNIEGQLESINQKLQKIYALEDNEVKKKTISKNEISGFSEEGASALYKEISKLFKKECKNRNLSIEDAVIELTPLIQQTFKMKYWSPIIEMFIEDKIDQSPEIMLEVYKKHDDTFPFLELIYKWCGKIPEQINDQYKEAIIR